MKNALKYSTEYTLKESIKSFTPADDFEGHWQVNKEVAIPQSKFKVAEEFLRPVLNDLQASGTRILDAGCGNAVHAAYLKRINLLSKLEFVGVDISLPVLIQNKKDYPDCIFLHADISDLPFADAQFDLAFSFGVIAYTKSPAQSVKELARVTKTGGYVGLWAYPRSSGIAGFAFNSVRSICQMLGPFMTRRIADLIVPFLAVLPTKSRVTLANASWKECREVVLVNIAPSRLYFPNVQEMEQWMEAADLEISYTDSQNPLTMWGRKR